MNYNCKTVPVKISRRELCGILCAIRCVAESLDLGGHSSRKWEILHENLKEQLDTFDAKNGGNET